MRLACRRWCACFSSFNPRPPSPRGDAQNSGRHATDDKVSIRAPRRRGAMRHGWPDLTANALFQSAPPVAEGRCEAATDKGGFDEAFQSAPPVAEGRCPAAGVTVRHYDGFNPRPPSPRGDAADDRVEVVAMSVSIRAPRRRGAMRNSRLPCVQVAGVSIRAPRRRGAMHRCGVR